jgi:hypothetical protein
MDGFPGEWRLNRHPHAPLLYRNHYSRRTPPLPFVDTLRCASDSVSVYLACPLVVSPGLAFGTRSGHEGHRLSRAPANQVGEPVEHARCMSCLSRISITGVSYSGDCRGMRFGNCSSTSGVRYGEFSPNYFPATGWPVANRQPRRPQRSNSAYCVLRWTCLGRSSIAANTASVRCRRKKSKAEYTVQVDRRGHGRHQRRGTAQHTPHRPFSSMRCHSCRSTTTPSERTTRSAVARSSIISPVNTISSRSDSSS